MFLWRFVLLSSARFREHGWKQGRVSNIFMNDTEQGDMGLHTMLFRTCVCKGAGTLTKIRSSTSPFCVLSSEPYRVLHDRQQRRFTVTLDDGGDVSLCSYRICLFYFHIIKRQHNICLINPMGKWHSVCFFVVCNVKGKAQNAVLQYSHRRKGHVHLLSTEVPESFRGKGVAASLAKVH